MSRISGILLIVALGLVIGAGIKAGLKLRADKQIQTKDVVCSVSVSDPVPHYTMAWAADGSLWVLKNPVTFSAEELLKVLKACQRPPGAPPISVSAPSGST